MLDEAGWVDSDGDGIRDKEIGGKLVPFEFSMLVSSKPDRIEICNLMRENLEAIGIICNVSPLEAAVLQERMFNKQFQAAFSGWGAGARTGCHKTISPTDRMKSFGRRKQKKPDTA